jgi:hypothetical protein
MKPFTVLTLILGAAALVAPCASNVAHGAS